VVVVSMMWLLNPACQLLLLLLLQEQSPGWIQWF
jgi:hypothetical protein